MPSRISYNVHAQRLANHDRLIAHLKAIQPSAVLVMDGVGLAQEIKNLLPNATVISRIYPDDDIHKRLTPEQWLERRAPEAAHGLYLYTTNEAGFGQDLIDWHVRLMELAAPRRIPLVIGNMSVGTPAAEDWPRARRMLELLDQHRDLFILGLHEYACGVITSGFLGGHPNNAGVAAFSAAPGRDLIAPQTWPRRDEAASMTKFHCGRFKFLVDYCHSIGLRAPRIILTEHGFDDVSDIKPWTETLLKTGSYQTIRGWKSAQNQWGSWYGGQGWSPQRAMFEQLAYADESIYQDSPVEAQLIFCWGHTSDQWEQFDVAEAGEFQSLLEAYAANQAALGKVNNLTAPASLTASFAPMPIGVQPVGYAPIGVRPEDQATQPAMQPVSAPMPVGFAPVGVQPGVNAKPGAAPPPPQHLDDVFTTDDLRAMLNRFRTLAESGAVDEGARADFRRWAAALERFLAARR